MTQPTHLSLCSGVGGLDMAIEQFYGARTIAHCENDKHASKVLATHWPGVHNLGDIKAISWWAAKAGAGSADIISAGYPCQPFSLAGKRAGTDDPRHLWPYVFEAIRLLRPRVVVLENVPGHRSKGFGEVLGSLATIGYDTQWTSVRACDIGAPHRRERVFIVAHPSGDGWHQGWSESARQQGRPDTAVSGGADLDLLPTPRAVDGCATMCAPASLAHVANGNGSLAEVIGALLPTPRTNDGNRTFPLERPYNKDNLATRVVRDLLPTPTASDATGGGSHPNSRKGHSGQLIDYALLDGTPEWGKYEPAIRLWESITRIAPSPTEPNRNGNPRLAAAFGEWMMGYPAGHVSDVDIPRNAQLRGIGNGVVTLQALAALTELHGAIDREAVCVVAA